MTYDITEASIVATASDPGARVIYSGAQDTDAAAEGLQFALDVGANEITVVVIASDGQTTETLDVTVTRGQAQVTLVVTPNSVGEDGGPATVTATVVPAAPADFTVEVALDVDTAVATLSDNATLSFAAGETESTGEVTITPINNMAHDGDVEVTISGTIAGATDVMAPDDVILTITDDELVPSAPRNLKVVAGDLVRH